MSEISEVGSSSPSYDNTQGGAEEFICTVKDMLPARDKPLCVSDIDLLKEDDVIDAIKKDLSDLPHESPHIFETRLFESIYVPYKYLWNKQYSLAVEAWELLFKAIQEIDAERFKTMHKGTPYYFCGVAAFEAKDYERAVFYFDAALQEDAKNYDTLRKSHPNEKSPEYRKAPAALFLTLDMTIKEQTAIELTKHTKRLMERSLDQFRESVTFNFDLNILQDCFLKKSLEKDDVKWRSAATALLSYVLESETRKREFSLRSAHGGTMESFFLHLFKGCLLFETLLKLLPEWPDGDLGNIWNDQTIRERLALTKEHFAEVKNKDFDDLVRIHNNWKTNQIPFNERVIWITYGIRNATAHKLSLSAKDVTVEDYQNLSDDILYAIILTISKLYFKE